MENSHKLWGDSDVSDPFTPRSTGMSFLRVERGKGLRERGNNSRPLEQKTLLVSDACFRVMM